VTTITHTKLRTLRLAADGFRLLRSCCSFVSRFCRCSCSSWNYR